LSIAVVVRRTLRATAVARPRVELLRTTLDHRARGSYRIGLVIIGEGPCASRDISQELNLPVLAELPFDPKAAQVLTHGGDGGRGFARSALLREAHAMSEKLQGQALDEQHRLHGPALPPQTGLDRMKGAFSGGPR
jgi:hypothetical protein